MFKKNTIDIDKSYWGLVTGPIPQSPIPNPQSPIIFYLFLFI